MYNEGATACYKMTESIVCNIAVVYMYIHTWISTCEHVFAIHKSYIIDTSMIHLVKVLARTAVIKDTIIMTVMQTVYSTLPEV